MTDDEPTLVERYRATDRGAVEYAAADLTAYVAYYFGQMKRASQVSQRTVAELLGVTEGRVSQVVSGDGNIAVAALAKYARAFGYTVEFVVTPAVPSAPALRRPGRRLPGPQSIRVTPEDGLTTVAGQPIRAGGGSRWGELRLAS